MRRSDGRKEHFNFCLNFFLFMDATIVAIRKGATAWINASGVVPE